MGSVTLVEQRRARGVGRSPGPAAGLLCSIHLRIKYPTEDTRGYFMSHFARLELARELVAALRGLTLLGDAQNGLFLAAPRRTGKSTFLQADLKPALEASGVAVVYVDLWADPRRDPGTLIADAVAKALAGKAGLLSKAAKRAGLESLTVAGLEIDLGRIGKVDGATLTDALRALREASGTPVALIVDEAQHALTSDAGEATMAALKSARDQLNRPGQVNLMLVMSGSDRDKLLRLVNTGGAPFYGSQVTRMPLLGRPFLEHLAALITAQRPELAPIDIETLQAAFEAFGSRPQFLMEALGQALSPLSGVQGVRFERTMLEFALERQRADEAQMEADFLALRPLERAVLWRLLEQGPRFRPYDAEALRFYRERVGDPVTVQMSQKALESLRSRNPSIVWKSARGEYAVDDAAMHRWYEQRARANRWPPADPESELAD
ncbi:MAG: ATP-binding protein [Planctomycetota bacterium]|nr:ATP-binding protein [Planctomycetota bacterium]